MAQIKKDLDDHVARPTETDLRLSNIEDDLYQAQATEQQRDKTNQFILQKLKDLENRSRWEQFAVL